MFELDESYPQDAQKLYPILNQQLTLITEDEPEIIPNLANVAALLAGALRDINWVGFYILKNDVLILGPFIGKPACVRIAIGKGVCGVAAQHNQVQRVADVHQYPGHIACDSASCSEIVLPLCDQNGQVRAVLDIDSPVFDRFSVIDQQGLENFVAILATNCNW